MGLPRTSKRGSRQPAAPETVGRCARIDQLPDSLGWEVIPPEKVGNPYNGHINPGTRLMSLSPEKCGNNGSF